MIKRNQLICGLVYVSLLTLGGCSNFLEKNVQVAPATGHRVCDNINRDLTFNNNQTDQQDQGAAFISQARLLRDYKKNDCEKFETK